MRISQTVFEWNKAFFGVIMKTRMEIEAKNEKQIIASIKENARKK